MVQIWRPGYRELEEGVFMSTVRTLAAILIANAATVCFAQFTSNIQGVVQDQSSAAIPAATVRLKSLATDVTQDTKSSDAGVYRFSSLQPGSYEITVEAVGFQARS